MSIWRERVCIEAGHPALPGHFPGQPVVPGVVLLDRVAALLERHGAGTLAAIGQVKFLAPLLPGQEATLEVQREGSGVQFLLTGEGGIVLMRGRASVEP